MDDDEKFMAVVLVFVFLMLGGFVWSAVSMKRDAAVSRVSDSAYAVTFQHDGHLFLCSTRREGGLLHHPDCTCQKGERQ